MLLERVILHDIYLEKPGKYECIMVNADAWFSYKEASFSICIIFLIHIILMLMYKIKINPEVYSRGAQVRLNPRLTKLFFVTRLTKGEGGIR